MIEVSPTAYAALLPLLEEPPFNVIFARAVLEGRMSGDVYVDDVERPAAVYVKHRFGLALLCGRSPRKGFAAAVVDHLLDREGRRCTLEQLQVYPPDWNDELRFLLGERLGPSTASVLPDAQVVEFGRVNFRFDRTAFAQLVLPPLADDLRIARAGEESYAPWVGGVIPVNFWDSPAAFVENGVGFAVLEANRAVCISFSAMLLDHAMEIGIESHPGARGRGFATHACAATIRYCLEAGVEPVWSTRHDNVGSRALARRLGFRETLHLPVYRLAMCGRQACSGPTP